MNISQARFNMVEQQIRPWDVLNPHILELITTLPREAFVPKDYKTLAFADTALPLGYGQFMLPPREQARMLQAVNPAPYERVLEIGSGSGYLTALLARTARYVTSIEIIKPLQQMAQKNLSQQNITNATVIEGDAAMGWEQDAPYDVIVITGSLPILPHSFELSLAVGGRLCAIVGEAPTMHTVLLTRKEQSDWEKETLYETVVPPLIHAAQPPHFEF